MGEMHGRSGAFRASDAAPTGFFSHLCTMRILINANIESVSPQELEADLGLLPPWRLAKTLAIKRPKGRVASVKAFLLLARALREDYGLAAVPEFAFGEHGKPYFPTMPHIHFNLSHCPVAAMCVVGDAEVGCDIEGISRRVSEGVMRKCYNDAEIARVVAAVSPGLEAVRLWTMKEAAGKLTGTGLNDDTPNFLLPENLAGVEISGCANFKDGYVCTVAAAASHEP